MKSPFKFSAPTFDAGAITETIQRALASAGLTSGLPTGFPTGLPTGLPTGFPTGHVRRGADSNVVDVVARVVEEGPGAKAEPPRRPSMDEPKTTGGTFETHEFLQPAGGRAYKLYVPARLAAAPPLLVMLHGCTQCADDFAAGTQMNRLADEHGFLVAYPEQTAKANPSKCWNWFKAQDQVRDAGEPALIAGIAREVAARHGVDTRRIFVAGLSAGAAMAVILGETYPELFAGVGAHSGLPYRSAHDIPSAMAAMKGGRGGSNGSNGVRAMVSKPSPHADHGKRLAQPVPTIVFHGDRDHTVQLSNGIEIAQQARNVHSGVGSSAALRASTERGARAGGRSYSRTVHTDAAGQVRVESWTVHGAGHAWAGGSQSGSYTDARGPDASAEMLRFFLSLPRAGSA